MSKVTAWKAITLILGPVHNSEVKVSEVTNFCPRELYRGIYKVLPGKQFSRQSPTQEKTSPTDKDTKWKREKRSQKRCWGFGGVYLWPDALDFNKAQDYCIANTF